MKLKIKSKQTLEQRKDDLFPFKHGSEFEVFINDIDCSKYIESLDLSLKGNEFTTATITFKPSEVELENIEFKNDD